MPTGTIILNVFLFNDMSIKKEHIGLIVMIIP